MCLKKDRGIRNGESDIKFERIAELKIENEHTCKSRIVDTRRCFLSSENFQHLTKLYQKFCLHLTLYFVPLKLKTSKSLIIRHAIPFLYSFL